MKSKISVNWTDLLTTIKQFKKSSINLEQLGEYRLGLTSDEIKFYLHLRAPRRNLGKLVRQFNQIAGTNTTAVTATGAPLMYRHDVQRFADKLLLRRGTYFD